MGAMGMGVRSLHRPPTARLPRRCDQVSVAPLVRLPLTPCRVRPRARPRCRASLARGWPRRPPETCSTAAWARRRWAWGCAAAPTHGRAVTRPRAAARRRAPRTPRAATPHAASRRLTLPHAAPCPLAPTHGRATTHGAMGMEVCSRRRPPAARLPRRCDRDSDRAACALAAHAVPLAPTRQDLTGVAAIQGSAMVGLNGGMGVDPTVQVRAAAAHRVGLRPCRSLSLSRCCRLGGAVSRPRAH